MTRFFTLPPDELEEINKVNKTMNWKQIEEKFDDKFCYYFDSSDDEESKDIKSFFHSHFLSLLQELDEECEKNKKIKPKTECRNAEMATFGRCFDCVKDDGYNSALSDIQSKLKEML